MEGGHADSTVYGDKNRKEVAFGAPALFVAYRPSDISKRNRSKGISFVERPEIANPR